MTLPRIGRKGSMLIGFGGYLVIGLVRRPSPLYRAAHPTDHRLRLRPARQHRAALRDLRASAAEVAAADSTSMASLRPSVIHHCSPRSHKRPGNLGPGNQLGLLSSECCAFWASAANLTRLDATPVRGTLYGFSAAFGKAGAAIGTQCFKVSAPILDTRI